MEGNSPMNFWQNISIRTKVFSAFACTLIVTIALGVFSILQLSDVNDAAADVRDNWLPTVQLLGRLVQQVEMMRNHEGLHILTTDDAGIAAMDAKIVKDRETIADMRKEYEPMVTPGTERKMVDDYDRLMASYLDIEPKMLALSRKNQNVEATAVFREELLPIFEQLRTTLLADLKFNSDEGHKAADKGAAIYHSAHSLIIGAIALAAALSIGASLAIIMGVATPIGLTTAVVKRLAAGELDVHVSGAERGDEVGSLAAALQVFKDNSIAMKKLEAEQEEMKKKAEAERKTMVLKVAQDFEDSVKGVVNIVASASTEMQSAAQSLSATAEETTRQSTTVAAASEQASANVQT
ncbi:MAG: HAMP domain-containing protein, partial [Rhodospirillaceae bacterium]